MQGHEAPFPLAGCWGWPGEEVEVEMTGESTLLGLNAHNYPMRSLPLLPLLYRSGN